MLPRASKVWSPVTKNKFRFCSSEHFSHNKGTWLPQHDMLSVFFLSAIVIWLISKDRKVLEGPVHSHLLTLLWACGETTNRDGSMWWSKIAHLVARKKNSEEGCRGLPWSPSRTPPPGGSNSQGFYYLPVAPQTGANRPHMGFGDTTDPDGSTNFMGRSFVTVIAICSPLFNYSG